MRDKYGDERRTEIIGERSAEILDEDLIPEEDNAVTISHDGYIKRLPLNTYRTQHRGGKGVSGGAATRRRFRRAFLRRLDARLFALLHQPGPAVLAARSTTSRSGAGRAAGRAIANVLSLKPDEKITSLIPVRQLRRPSGHLFMATRRGLVKKTALAGVQPAAARAASSASAWMRATR